VLESFLYPISEEMGLEGIGSIVVSALVAFIGAWLVVSAVVAFIAAWLVASVVVAFTRAWFDCTAGASKEKDATLIGP
jgi:hypothetical protein